MGMFEDEYVEPTDSDTVAQEAEPESGLAEFDDQVAEAEARLREVDYYRNLLKSTIFDSTNDPIAQRVNKKVHEMARRELGVLLGVQSAQAKQSKDVASLWSDTQVATLSTLASLTEDDLRALKSLIAQVHTLKPRMVQTPTPQVMVQPKPTPLPVPATKPRPASAKKKVTPKKELGGSSESQERTDKANSAPKAPLKSPHSKPMPTGEEFSALSAAMAESSAMVGMGLARKKLGG